MALLFSVMYVCLLLLKWNIMLKIGIIAKGNGLSKFYSTTYISLHIVFFLFLWEIDLIIFPYQIHHALGEWIYWLTTCVGRVCPEKEWGKCSESPSDLGRFGGQLGSRHSSYQHSVPEGQADPCLRQRVEGEDGFQAVPGKTFYLPELQDERKIMTHVENYP